MVYVFSALCSALLFTCVFASQELPSGILPVGALQDESEERRQLEVEASPYEKEMALAVAIAFLSVPVLCTSCFTCFSCVNCALDERNRLKWIKCGAVSTLMSLVLGIGMSTLLVELLSPINSSPEPT